jgi:type 2 lantibiotic biosynthesis protein LanM
LHGFDAEVVSALQVIVAEAAYWWERLDWTTELATQSPERNADAAASWLERWRVSVAGGDEALFRKRLRAAGLDPGAALERVGASPGLARGDLPGWAFTIGEILSGASDVAANATAVASAIDPDDPVPFEHVLEPIVRLGAARLRGRLAPTGRGHGSDPLDQFSDTALRAIERTLLRRLASVVAPALYVEFCASRPAGLTLLWALDDSSTEDPGSLHYERFAHEMLADGLRAFFSRYPVAARLVACVLDRWVETTAELVVRFVEDRGEICRQLCASGSSGDSPPAETVLVADAEMSLSDAHRGGRSVAVLLLTNGRKVVYKPKPLGLEAAFAQFLNWCNSASPRVDLRTILVIDRGTYGWAEFIEQAPCESLEAVRRYYRRAGMLLCVLHLLRATDCHHGNLVAAGEYPVLVDTETLLNPTFRPTDAAQLFEAPEATEAEFASSVLRTMLLPTWHVSADGQIAYDISGLGGVGGDMLPHDQPVWRGINTDGMVLQNGIAAAPAERNVVRIGDRPAVATDFASEIAAGFEVLYRLLLDRQVELRIEGSPLSQMQELSVRVLFRSTRIYALVLRAACAPENLRSGLSFSVELDSLSGAFLDFDAESPAWSILEAELAALQELDIPHFEVPANSGALPVPGGTTLESSFERSGYEDVMERVSRLGDDDLRWQLAIVRGSLHARVARNTHSASGSGPAPVPDASVEEFGDMSAEANRIADELEQGAIVDARTGANWLGLGMVAETEHVRLQLIGDGLYEGRCGVALFLAALGMVTGSRRWDEIVQLALQPLRSALREANSESLRSRTPVSQSVGGVGAVIYALVRISEFLSDASLLNDASYLGASLTSEDVNADAGLDVLSGSAGAILGLVSLGRATGETAPIELARLFGEHLLEQRVSDRGLPLAWSTIAPRPLTGFSHGAAGIAYSLLRLYQVCGDDRFRLAAQEGIRYERALFSDTKCNWPDLRHGDRESDATYPVQWCHGAAGIALARLGGNAIALDDETNDEVSAALGTVTQAGQSSLDHLCCGNMGRIEALWVGAHRTGSRAWHDTALSYASQLRARVAREQSYKLFSNLPGAVFNPGFFRGVSGIGYEWLRLGYPELQSVLLWE